MAFLFRRLVPKTMEIFPTSKACLLKTIAIRCINTTAKKPPRPIVETKPPQHNIVLDQIKNKKEILMTEEKDNKNMLQDNNSMVKTN
ncbi:hypothetical protein A4A49_43190 [Nicotiana attenuata]|uniref:Uncharacterized protein n=1 Tax=Nicotiana attenuata TaxID=49451 RepID=A0A1J6KA58_NICAT|nr:hypothetical protein A4A49_43190 [Nicotiana attenuata]